MHKLNVRGTIPVVLAAFFGTRTFFNVLTLTESHFFWMGPRNLYCQQPHPPLSWFLSSRKLRISVLQYNQVHPECLNYTIPNSKKVKALNSQMSYFQKRVSFLRLLESTSLTLRKGSCNHSLSPSRTPRKECSLLKKNTCIMKLG